jgi:hypothetical protein
VYQELHEGLPDYLGRSTIRHHHIHQTIEREQSGNFRDDEELFDGFLTSKARHTLSENVNTTLSRLDSVGKLGDFDFFLSFYLHTTDLPATVECLDEQRTEISMGLK